MRELIQGAEEVLFSSVVVGEQLYGFRQGLISSGTWRNFGPSSTAYVSFVPVGPVTADRHSRIMTALRAKGRPMPTNELRPTQWRRAPTWFDSHFQHVEIAWVRASSS